MQMQIDSFGENNNQTKTKQPKIVRKLRFITFPKQKDIEVNNTKNQHKVKDQQVHEISLYSIFQSNINHSKAIISKNENGFFITTFLTTLSNQNSLQCHQMRIQFILLSKDFSQKIIQYSENNCFIKDKCYFVGQINLRQRRILKLFKKHEQKKQHKKQSHKSQNQQNQQNNHIQQENTLDMHHKFSKYMHILYKIDKKLTKILQQNVQKSSQKLQMNLVNQALVKQRHKTQTKVCKLIQDSLKIKQRQTQSKIKKSQQLQNENKSNSQVNKNKPQQMSNENNIIKIQQTENKKQQKLTQSTLIFCYHNQLFEFLVKQLICKSKQTNQLQFSLNIYHETNSKQIQHANCLITLKSQLIQKQKFHHLVYLCHCSSIKQQRLIQAANFNQLSQNYDQIFNNFIKRQSKLNQKMQNLYQQAKQLLKDQLTGVGIKKVGGQLINFSNLQPRQMANDRKFNVLKFSKKGRIRPPRTPQDQQGKKIKIPQLDKGRKYFTTQVLQNIKQTKKAKNSKKEQDVIQKGSGINIQNGSIIQQIQQSSSQCHYSDIQKYNQLHQNSQQQCINLDTPQQAPQQMHFKTVAPSQNLNPFRKHKKKNTNYNISQSQRERNQLQKLQRVKRLNTDIVLELTQYSTFNKEHKVDVGTLNQRGLQMERERILKQKSEKSSIKTKPIDHQKIRIKEDRKQKLKDIKEQLNNTVKAVIKEKSKRTMNSITQKFGSPFDKLNQNEDQLDKSMNQSTDKLNNSQDFALDNKPFISIPLVFDQSAAGYHQFSISGKSFYKTGGFGYQAMILNHEIMPQGRKCYKLRISVTKTIKSCIMLGIMQSSMKTLIHSCLYKNYIGFRSFNSMTTINIEEIQIKRKQKAIPVKDGDFITMIIDMDTRVIVWDIGDKGRAKVDIPVEVSAWKWVAFVGLFHKEDSVELVQVI